MLRGSRQRDLTSGMLNRWRVGVNNGSTGGGVVNRDTGTTNLFSVISIEGGEVVANLAPLQWAIWDKKGRCQHVGGVHGKHGIRKKNQLHIRDPPLKEWEMHKFGVHRLAGVRGAAQYWMRLGCAVTVVVGVGQPEIWADSMCSRAFH